uniref:Death domain-associated protein 6 n=1 Tax=Amphilophus citrinellus TaxID=61819 RepID=A0A3Q0RIG8_AMPCI
MAVAPASMADKIIVLDEDDEEESPQASFSASKSTPKHQAKNVSPLKAQQPVPTHITQSPFATAKKTSQVLQFVEHCTPLTEDCPEVLTFLQTKHSKACPVFLSSVEFRNTLGRCLTRAQANRSKTFVYINELCTVLRQYAVKRRQDLSKVEPGPSTSTSSNAPSTSITLRSKTKSKGRLDEEEGVQIAYLENLLKVYNDEICRLQQAELSLDDLEAEDSLYIQEHKLKRKIYEKLCELKGCSTLTGRAIEQRIPYKATRYPEINRRIERFINSPEVRSNPPDYQDVRQQVLRANDRHSLCLSRKQLNQIAQEAFRETGSRIQERRHLDLVYNFGSHLTDAYKPATDPALSDQSLLRKLRSNREVALTRLEEVITKYAVKQEDTEEQERSRRPQKDGKNKEVKEELHLSLLGSCHRVRGRVHSLSQGGKKILTCIYFFLFVDDDEDEDDDVNEVEEASEGANKEDLNDDQRVSAGEDGSLKDGEDEQVTSPASDETKSQISPQSDIPSPADSPSQSEPTETDDQRPLSNGDHGGLQEPVDSSNHDSVMLLNTNQANTDLTTANGKLSPSSPREAVENNTQTTNGTSPPPSPRTTRSQKRKREEIKSGSSQSRRNTIIHDR